jgi:hypothetical protein
MYDVRLRDSYPSCGMSWPPDLTDVTPYLRVPPPPPPEHKLTLVARRRRPRPQHRQKQKENRLARMLRRRLRRLPNPQLCPRHNPPPLPPRTPPNPPLLRRQRLDMQSPRHRRTHPPHDMAKRNGLRRPPRFRVLGPAPRMGVRRRTSGVLSDGAEFDVRVVL